MTKTFLLAIAAIILVSSMAVSIYVLAQEQPLGQMQAKGTQIRVQPDSWIYKPKLLGESVVSLFTFGDRAKAERNLYLFQKRLKETECLLNKGKGTDALRILKKGQGFLQKAIAQYKKLQKAGESAAKLNETIRELFSSFPETTALIEQKLGKNKGAKFAQIISEAEQALRTDTSAFDAPESPVLTTESPFGINNPYYWPEPVDLYKQIGVQNVRFWFQWHEIEPKKGSFQWVQSGHNIDQQMINLKNNNAVVLGVLGNLAAGNPCWAQHPRCRKAECHRQASTKDGCRPADFKDYTDFVRRLVRRYKPNGELARQQGWGNTWGISQWEVLNEPMYQEEWRVPRDENSAAMYVKLLRETYKVIKEEDPKAIVMNGGIDTAPSEVSGLDLDVARLYKLGAKNYFDVLAVHFYTNPGQSYRDVIKEIRGIKDIMKRHGDRNKPLWDNEGSQLLNYGIPEKIQSLFMMRFFTTQLAEKIPKIFWFSTFQSDSPPIATGLVDQGKAKLSAYTYKLLVDKLTGSDWNKTTTIKEDEKERVYAYKFIKNGKSIYVAWWDYCDFKDIECLQQPPKNTKQIILPVDFIGNALITSAAPNADKGADLKPEDYPKFFPTQTIPVNNGKITLQLGADPVFVEKSK